MEHRTRKTNRAERAASFSSAYFWKFLFLFLFSVGMALAWKTSDAADTKGSAVPPGKDLYGTQCAPCHGIEGKGDGPAAEFLYPKPRNFTLAQFKFRSTPFGKLPTDQDLLKILNNGIPGSAMPSFGALSADQKEALVQYVKTFAVRVRDGKSVNLFESKGPPTGITVPEPPASTPERVADGKKIYDQIGCAKCHGDTGEGNGPAAASLTDSNGWPIPPANFARGIFKGGDSVSDIYLRFITGINGTPMPSFDGTLSDDEIWSLAYYVKSLVRKDIAVPSRVPQTIHAVKAQGKIPSDPNDAMWGTAKPQAVALMATWQRPVAPPAVTVRVLYTDSEIGFLLEWQDPTVDGAVVLQSSFSDAAALMFPLTVKEGHFAMGSKDQPVNIWQWRFSRQAEWADFGDMKKFHTEMAVDTYPLKSEEATYLTGKGAGNTLSVSLPASPVEDLNAIGFGTLTSQPPVEQNVKGQGVWQDGNWKVVLTRVRAGNPMDADLKGTKETKVAFAVWDGSSGDRDGKKSVTNWQPLVLD